MTDYAVGDTFDVKFTTRQFSDGVPTTLAGTPSVAAYPDNSTTELTAGITLTVDFDTRTGLNNVRVVATTGNGYASGSTYYLVITAGTVGGTSVVGEVVGEFTLGRSAAASRLGLTSVSASTGDPGTTTTAIAYLKQLINILIGTNGIATFPAEAAPGNAVSLAEVIRAIHTDTNALNDTKVPDTISLANINAEVDTALATTTYAEPGQGTPAATASLKDKIGYIYKFLRNRVTSTSTTISVYNDDATTVDQKSTHSDDGSTYDRGEFTTGA